MSHTRLVVWKCDRCGWEFQTVGTSSPMDDLMPEGWIFTMMGEDLCPECQR